MLMQEVCFVYSRFNTIVWLFTYFSFFFTSSAVWGLTFVSSASRLKYDLKCLKKLFVYFLVYSVIVCKLKFLWRSSLRINHGVFDIILRTFYWKTCILFMWVIAQLYKIIIRAGFAYIKYFREYNFSYRVIVCWIYFGRKHNIYYIVNIQLF